MTKPTADDRKWQAEDDFRTLERAEEVRCDHQRHRRALSHGTKRVRQMKRILKGRSKGRR